MGKIKIGQTTFVFAELEKDPEAVESHCQIGAFNAFSFLNATSKSELIGLMVATGLVSERHHAAKWMTGKMGGYGNIEVSKKRAMGWYRSKYGIK